MKSEQIKEITEKATDQLVAALQQGHGEALTTYLKARAIAATGGDDEPTLAVLSDADTTTVLGRDLAGAAIIQRATRALAGVPQSIRRHTFLMAGWWQFKGLPGLRSHMGLITNEIDASGRLLAEPSKSFQQTVRALRDDEAFLWRPIGQTMVVNGAVVWSAIYTGSSPGRSGPKRHCGYLWTKSCTRR
jgi:hypothetical protein